MDNLWPRGVLQQCHLGRSLLEDGTKAAGKVKVCSHTGRQVEGGGVRGTDKPTVTRVHQQSRSERNLFKKW